MQIRNQDFDFDVLNATDADRFQQAVNELQAAAAIPKTSGLGDIIRANCAAIDSFLADLLGEDYDIRLNIDTNNLRQLQAIYYEFLDACTAAQNEIQAMRTVGAVASVDVKAQAAAAAKQAAQTLPTPAQALAAPAQAPKAAPVDFSKMNRAQRRAYVKALAGRK